MSREYFVIDAFAGEPGQGNRAAVVFDAQDLTDLECQSIATEFGFSETTFVLLPTRPEADLRFRWFTPAVEVNMCGHATIAGVHALLESGRVAIPEDCEARALRIETRSGVLEARPESLPEDPGAFVVWLELPVPRLEPFVLTPEMVQRGLCTTLDVFDPKLPAARTSDGDAILAVRSVALLNDLRPDFAALAQQCDLLDMRGVAVTTRHTLSPAVHAQTRFFAPACGVDEDPVTGSAHGPLLAYLFTHGVIAEQGGMIGAIGYQAIPGGRGGQVHMLGRVESGKVLGVQIAGQAVTIERGSMA